MRVYVNGAGSIASIANNAISGNNGGEYGGMMVNAQSGSMTITNNSITGNTAGSTVGGMAVSASDPGTQVTIDNNTLPIILAPPLSPLAVWSLALTFLPSLLSLTILSAANAGLNTGGLKANTANFGSVSITNNTISDNTLAGGLNVYSHTEGPIVVSNNTCTGNKNRYYGGGICAVASAAGRITITNNNVSANEALNIGLRPRAAVCMFY